MSNYTKTTDFGAKDSLPTGDSGKIIRGTEFETEFDAISTAIATKADIAGPTFTGTLTYETISDGTISITGFVDEDDMSSDSVNLVPTQQSVKAYVDSQVTAQDLDFQADTGGALSIDLDSESLTFTGGTGIDTSGLGNAVTFAIDSTVATLTGTQTLTNKTLTSPDVNTPDIDGGTIDGTVIGGTTPAAVSATTVSATGNITVGGTVDGRDVAADGTKLDGIESGATADQTAAEIRTLVESATDSNVFTDADHTKLDGIEANATADQTDAEIRAAVEAATDSNVFTDADHSKLDGIEALADVTDTTNVTAAGALMDSELTDITAVKALDQGVATTDSPTFAGLTTTADVSFGDNDKAIFGAGSDLQIYHDGVASRIVDSGTGNLTLRGEDLYLQNADGSKTYANFGATNGDTTLWYNNLIKFKTTSTGIDVTGNVVSDGLTVDGTANLNSAVTITSTSAALFFMESDTTDLNTRLRNNGGNFALHTVDDSKATVALRFAVDHSSGDISFYEDTGTTAKFYWDASAESLGIGTNSPARPLDVNGAIRVADANAVEWGGANEAIVGDTGGALIYKVGGSEVMRNTSTGLGIGTSSPSTRLHTDVTGGDNELRVATTTSGDPSISFHANGAGAHQIAFDRSDLALTFTTVGSSERMRIDSSGNVGIGTSSPSKQLHIKGSTITGATADTNTQLYLENNANNSIQINSGATNNGQIRFGDASSNYRGALTYSHSNDSLQFVSAGLERMRIDSSGNIGIGTTSPTTIATSTSSISLGGTSSTVSGGIAYQINGVVKGYHYVEGNFLIHQTVSGIGQRFWADGSEAMRIDASGNLLVGKTSSAIAGAGTAILASGTHNVTVDGDTTLQLNRLTSDGAIATFFKDGSTVGSIGSVLEDSLSRLYIAQSDTGLKFNNGPDYIVPCTSSGANRDDVIDLGASGARFDDIYATNGTIQTSDRNEKQDIEALSDAEQRVAVACKGLLRKFRWKSSVADNGDEARIHFGIIAQDLQDAFTAEGLDAGRYAMFISTTWTDEETGEERTRMGVRYSELLAFIIAAI